MRLGRTEIHDNQYLAKPEIFPRHMLTAIIAGLFLLVTGFFVVLPSASEAGERNRYYSGKSTFTNSHLRKNNHRRMQKTLRHKSARMKYTKRSHRALVKKQHRSPHVSRYTQRRKTMRRQTTKSFYPSRKYDGPQVIDVHKALRHNRKARMRHDYRGHKSRKRLKITTTNTIAAEIAANVTSHVIRDGTRGEVLIYYNDAKCEGGYDCIMRLGKSPSSAKVIVVGEKRAMDFVNDNTQTNEGKETAAETLPRIIYPPSNYDY